MIVPAVSSAQLTFVGSSMSPYSQRVSIILSERRTRVNRINVDLGHKPAWYSSLAPMGRVPLLRVRNRGLPEQVLFESMAIIEFLEETHPDQPLYPQDLVARAEHRGW
jgi:glutathione S-transferase